MLLKYNFLEVFGRRIRKRGEEERPVLPSSIYQIILFFAAPLSGANPRFAPTGKIFI